MSEGVSAATVNQASQHHAQRAACSVRVRVEVRCTAYAARCVEPVSIGVTIDCSFVLVVRLCGCVFRYFLLILVLMIIGFANATFVLLHNSYDADGHDITPRSHSNLLRSIVQVYSGVMGASESTVRSGTTYTMYFVIR